MQNKEWVNPEIKKEEWLDGAWKTEPDKIQFVDEATGLPCLIVRNNLGALCGYVGVDKNHPYYGKGYDDVPCTSAHGGLTFAGHCQKTDNEYEGICHKVEDGEDDKVWWLGFDCAHYQDFVPAMEATIRKHMPESGLLPMETYSNYKDIEFVRATLKNMAAEIKVAA